MAMLNNSVREFLSKIQTPVNSHEIATRFNLSENDSNKMLYEYADHHLQKWQTVLYLFKLKYKKITAQNQNWIKDTAFFKIIPLERIKELWKNFVILHASIFAICPPNFEAEYKLWEYLHKQTSGTQLKYQLGNHSDEYCLKNRKREFEESKIDFKSYVQNKWSETVKIAIKDNKSDFITPFNDEDKENIDIDTSRKVIKCNLKFKASGALSGLNNILNQASANNWKINDFSIFKEKPTDKNERKDKAQDDDQLSPQHKRTFVWGKKKRQLEKEEIAKAAKANKRRKGFYDESDGDRPRIDVSIKNMGTIKSENVNKISVSVLPFKTDRRKERREQEPEPEPEPEEAQYEEYVASESADSSVFELNSQDIDKTLLERKRDQKRKLKQANEVIDANYDYNWEDVKPDSLQDTVNENDENNNGVLIEDSDTQKPHNDSMNDEALSKLAMRDIMAEVTIAEKYEEQQRLINEDKKKSAKELFKSRKQKPQKEESDEQYEVHQDEIKNDSDNSSDVQLVEEKDIPLLKKEAKIFKSKKEKTITINDNFIEEIDVGDMDEEYDVKKDKNGEYEEKKVFKSKFKVRGKKALPKKKSSKFLWRVKRINH